MSTFESYRGTVYPWQCDHMGHMNVMWYVGKFDEATWSVFSRLGLTNSYLRANQRGMAAVEQTIRYQREILPGEVIVIVSQLLEHREKVLRIRHTMQHAELGHVAATMDLVGVHLDTTARKSIAFDTALRQHWVAHTASPEPS